MTSESDALNGPAVSRGGNTETGASPGAEKSSANSKPLKSLDKDLKGVGWLQKASSEQSSRLTGLSLGFLFLV
ncbi:MAG: hypothetical protein OEQ29_22565, partial [Alphaproteobacteria bacterium]|nr:hypothetical protein [Alphaproteobacteria bacterium]